MYKIYLEKQDVNDATSYYISIIENSIKLAGKECQIISTLDQIDKTDTIIVVKVSAFVKVKLRNFSQKIVIWIQGIQPEEALMADNYSLFRKYCLYFIYKLFEFVVLKNAKFIFFVSEAMKNHYSGLMSDKINYYIMPCFNLPLNPNAFYVEGKYDNPTYVYAGSMNKWQCVDDVLGCFSYILELAPKSRLAILTNEQEVAKEKVCISGLHNIEVKYVKKEMLQTELAKYKFGFLLREDIEVNNVATPTKLNSYMSCGLIPIYSDVISDFKKHLKDCRYIVGVEDCENYKTNALKIVDFDNRAILPLDIYNDYRSIFDSYYNRDKYEMQISELVNKGLI